MTSRFFGRSGVLVFCLMATSLLAAVSPAHQQWRNGPVQWIMTPEEQRAWKAVRTDDEAAAFIDLFWARRDPTSGTLANEFRMEFEGRVQFADKSFAEGKRRGAMSDRGRVYCLLGRATNMSNEMEQSTSRKVIRAAGDSVDPTGGRVLGARHSWIWEHADALRFGMPRVEVVFIEDPMTHVAHRDTQKTDFGGAAAAAMRMAVVNPTLTKAPEWAAHGGLATVASTVSSGPVFSAKPTVPAEAAATPRVATGMSRMMLLADVSALHPEVNADPLAGKSSVLVFHTSDDLGWAAQYCSEKTETPMLKIGLHLTGKTAREKISSRAEPDEIFPDQIKALPGCYLVRGSVPLQLFSAGTFELEISIEDPADGQSYKLKRDFTIE